MKKFDSGLVWIVGFLDYWIFGWIYLRISMILIGLLDASYWIFGFVALLDSFN